MDEIKKKVQLELDIETNVNDKSVNRYQKFIDMALALDSWRIFPRIFITVYIILLYNVITWFMSLENPNTQQAGLVSIMTGIGAAWFSLYLNSGNKNE
jgi:hypothetical protein